MKVVFLEADGSYTNHDVHRDTFEVSLPVWSAPTVSADGSVIPEKCNAVRYTHRGETFNRTPIYTHSAWSEIRDLEASSIEDYLGYDRIRVQERLFHETGRLLEPGMLVLSDRFDEKHLEPTDLIRLTLTRRVAILREQP